MTSTTDRAADGGIARPVRSSRAATFGRIALLALGALAVETATSQVHHHYAPADAGGWRELPLYAVTALLAYGVSCLFLLRARRSRRASAPALLAMGLGVLAVLSLVFYWSALPLTWGGTALLLAWDAPAGRTAMAAKVLGAVAVVGVLAVLGYRLAGGMANLGG